MLKQIATVACALVVGGVLLGAQAPAGGAKAPARGPDPWFVRTTKVQVQPQRAVDAPVQIDMPKKDWMALPSSGSVLMTLIPRKADAVVTVDLTTLRQELKPEDITDLFAQIEIDAIKERSPKASDFDSRVIDSGGQRLVAVQYVRPGVFGAEKVRQYSVPMGKRLFRITCVTAAAQFAALDALFAHMAASFSVTQ